MCRKNHLQGCCLAAFGMGLLVGYNLESWLLCVCGGCVLTVLGLCILKKRC